MNLYDQLRLSSPPRDREWMLRLLAESLSMDPEHVTNQFRAELSEIPAILGVELNGLRIGHIAVVYLEYQLKSMKAMVELASRLRSAR